MAHLDKLLPEKHYHIFNHSVGNENLFRSHDNFLFFLSRYHKHLFPLFKTYAYCLMPNHFHLLIQVREDEVIRKLAKTNLQTEFDYHKFIMQQFSNFLNSYSKAFNKQHKRKGALFIDYTKRKEITNENYFTRIVNYIHQNPVHHNFCKTPSDWEYSSFNSIVRIDKFSHLERDSIFDWFGGIEKFVEFHQQESYFDSELGSTL